MIGTVLEILKFTIPGLIVFATAYYLQKQYHDSLYQRQALESRSKYSKDAIPLKLQAYERLLLFCDRIHIPNLILRLKTSSMTAGQLKNAMVVSVQKEYEHNLAQQLYTSQNLWDIITLAKNDTIALIFDSAKSLSPDALAEELSSSLLHKLNTPSTQPLQVATKAIKEEAKIILNV